MQGTMDRRELDRIIDTYHVSIAGGGRIRAVVPSHVSDARASEVIGANKRALIDRINEREAERRAGDARVAAIPMLRELRAYRRAMADYRHEVERGWERGEGRWPSEPTRPEGDTTEAEAYLALEGMSCASNYAKAAAGHRGIEAVRSGEKSPSEALADAKAEWDAAISEAMWH